MRTGIRRWIEMFVATAVIAGAGSAIAQAEPSASVRAAYEQALAASPTPARLAREQALWLQDRERAEAQGADALTDMDALRIEELNEDRDRDIAARALRLSLSAFGQGCVAIALNDCQTRSGGYLNGEDGGRLYWQLQHGFTERDGVGGGFVLLALEADGETLRPVAWDFEGYEYQAPQLIQDMDPQRGLVHVAVPGTYMGTGAHNADALFRWTGDASAPLVQTDNYSWRDDLDARLPEGLEVWKGVDFRYGALMAITSLWTPQDANCCPSGGEAVLDFRLDEDRLTLVDIHVSDAIRDLAERVPADIYAYAQRRMACEHWSGEEAYDETRGAQIAEALQTHRCDALDADGRALRRAYEDSQGLLQLISRAEAG